MELNENAIKVLKSRYLLRDTYGHFMKTPEQLFGRVAKAIAQAELNYGTEANVREMEEQFVRMIQDLLFLPNSSTLMNAGTKLGHGHSEH